MNAGNLEYVYLYFCERYRDEMVRLPDIQQTHPIHSLVDIPSFQGRGQLANAPSLPPLPAGVPCTGRFVYIMHFAFQVLIFMYRKCVTRTGVTVLQHGLDRTTHDKTPFLSCAGM